MSFYDDDDFFHNNIRRHSHRFLISSLVGAKSILLDTLKTWNTHFSLTVDTKQPHNYRAQSNSDALHDSIATSFLMARIPTSAIFNHV